MESPADDPITPRIAAQVRSLRLARGLSLEALAAASGVSKSALSLIERAESSPTAVVLDRIAAGLGVQLADLFGPAAAPVAAASPVVRQAEQAIWRDPGSGYLRRLVSPPGVPSMLQLIEVTFPAGARVAYETGPRDRVVHQQIWMLAGRMAFTLGPTTHSLAAGDCIAFVLDQPTAFRNPTRQAARYAVVLGTETLPRR